MSNNPTPPNDDGNQDNSTSTLQNNNSSNPVKKKLSLRHLAQNLRQLAISEKKLCNKTLQISYEQLAQLLTDHFPQFHQMSDQILFQLTRKNYLFLPDVGNLNHKSLFQFSIDSRTIPYNLIRSSIALPAKFKYAQFEQCTLLEISQQYLSRLISLYLILSQFKIQPPSSTSNDLNSTTLLYLYIQILEISNLLHQVEPRGPKQNSPAHHLFYQAFWINILNAMALHHFILFGNTKTLGNASISVDYCSYSYSTILNRLTSSTGSSTLNSNGLQSELIKEQNLTTNAENSGESSKISNQTPSQCSIADLVSFASLASPGNNNLSKSFKIIGKFAPHSEAMPGDSPTRRESNPTIAPNKSNIWPTPNPLLRLVLCDGYSSSPPLIVVTLHDIVLFYRHLDPKNRPFQKKSSLSNHSKHNHQPNSSSNALLNSLTLPTSLSTPVKSRIVSIITLYCQKIIFHPKAFLIQFPHRFSHFLEITTLPRQILNYFNHFLQDNALEQFEDLIDSSNVHKVPLEMQILNHSSMNYFTFQFSRDLLDIYKEVHSLWTASHSYKIDSTPNLEAPVITVNSCSPTTSSKSFNHPVNLNNVTNIIEKIAFLDGSFYGFTANHILALRAHLALEMPVFRKILDQNAFISNSYGRKKTFILNPLSALASSKFYKDQLRSSPETHSASLLRKLVYTITLPFTMKQFGAFLTDLGMLTQIQEKDFLSLPYSSQVAFWLNIYHTLLLYALLIGNPTEVSFTFKYTFKIFSGCHQFSLDDISNILLRNNRPSVFSKVFETYFDPTFPFERFSIEDPRNKFLLPFVDWRIHFCLIRLGGMHNIFSTHIPQLRIYMSSFSSNPSIVAATHQYSQHNQKQFTAPQGIDGTLSVLMDKTTHQFLTSSIEFRMISKTTCHLVLPAVFHLFRSDFGWKSPITDHTVRILIGDCLGPEDRKSLFNKFGKTSIEQILYASPFDLKNKQDCALFERLNRRPSSVSSGSSVLLKRHSRRLSTGSRLSYSSVTSFESFNSRSGTGSTTGLTTQTGTETGTETGNGNGSTTNPSTTTLASQATDTIQIVDSENSQEKKSSNFGLASPNSATAPHLRSSAVEPVQIPSSSSNSSLSSLNDIPTPGRYPKSSINIDPMDDMDLNLDLSMNLKLKSKNKQKLQQLDQSVSQKHQQHPISEPKPVDPDPDPQTFIKAEDLVSVWRFAEGQRISFDIPPPRSTNITSLKAMSLNYFLSPWPKIATTLLKPFRVSPQIHQLVETFRSPWNQSNKSWKYRFVISSFVLAPDSAGNLCVAVDPQTHSVPSIGVPLSSRIEVSDTSFIKAFDSVIAHSSGFMPRPSNVGTALIAAAENPRWLHQSKESSLSNKVASLLLDCFLFLQAQMRLNIGVIHPFPLVMKKTSDAKATPVAFIFSYVHYNSQFRFRYGSSKVECKWKPLSHILQQYYGSYSLVPSEYQYIFPEDTGVPLRSTRRRSISATAATLLLSRSKIDRVGRPNDDEKSKSSKKRMKRKTLSLRFLNRRNSKSSKDSDNNELPSRSSTEERRSFDEIRQSPRQSPRPDSSGSSGSSGFLSSSNKPVCPIVRVLEKVFRVSRFHDPGFYLYMIYYSVSPKGIQVAVTRSTTSIQFLPGHFFGTSLPSPREIEWLQQLTEPNSPIHTNMATILSHFNSAVKRSSTSSSTLAFNPSSHDPLFLLPQKCQQWLQGQSQLIGSNFPVMFVQACARISSCLDGDVIDLLESLSHRLVHMDELESRSAIVLCHHCLYPENLSIDWHHKYRWMPFRRLELLSQITFFPALFRAYNQAFPPHEDSHSSAKPRKASGQISRKFSNFAVNTNDFRSRSLWNTFRWMNAIISKSLAKKRNSREHQISNFDISHHLRLEIPAIILPHALNFSETRPLWILLLNNYQLESEEM